MPVDFERGEPWLEHLGAAGFDDARPALFASMGVSMYLTREALTGLLTDLARRASGSTLVMSFMLPIELAEPALRPGIEAAGTPS